MPWNPPTKTFIRENTDFEGPTVWQQDQQAGIKIIAARHDDHDQDIANGISATLNLDGLNAMRANLDMGGSYKVINLADGTVDTDAVTVSQLDALGLALQDQINSNDTDISELDSRVTVIEDSDPLYVNSLAIKGKVNQQSGDVAGSGSGSMVADATTQNRWTAANNTPAGATLNITVPDAPIAFADGPVNQYTAEGTIIFTNGTTPGNITIQLNGVATAAVNVLGANPVTPNTKYLLTYVVTRLAAGSFNPIFIWSAMP